jgi:sugar phosphate isomerase/epimerase
LSRVVLGINNCFAVKRWAEPREWARLVREELGLSTCQLSLDLFPPGFAVEPAYAYAQASREAAAEVDLSLHSVFTGLAAYSSNLLLSSEEWERDAAEAWYRRVVELTAVAGAKGAGGHIGALSTGANRDEQRRNALVADEVRRLVALGHYAADQGLEFMLFENLAVAREYGHTIEEACSLEEALAEAPVPWVLCLDLGHAAVLQTGTRSDDQKAWLDVVWRNTPVLQVSQQTERGVDAHGPFTEPKNRAGLVRRDAILGELGSWAAEEVFVFLEVIPAHEADDATVLKELVESVEHWRGGIEAYGLSKS